MLNSEIIKIQRLLNRLKIYNQNNKPLKEDGLVDENYYFALNKFREIVGLCLNSEKEAREALELIASKKLLKENDEHFSVKYLQWVLKINSNGKYDMRTVSAVIKYQNKNKIATDGIVGKETWTKILG